LFFESILLYFATLLASGCVDNQYVKGKEKVVINIHFKDALCCWGYHLRLFFLKKDLFIYLFIYLSTYLFIYLFICLFEAC